MLRKPVYVNFDSKTEQFEELFPKFYRDGMHFAMLIDPRSVPSHGIHFKFCCNVTSLVWSWTAMPLVVQALAMSCVVPGPATVCMALDRNAVWSRIAMPCVVLDRPGPRGSGPQRLAWSWSRNSLLCPGPQCLAWSRTALTCEVLDRNALRLPGPHCLVGSRTALPCGPWTTMSCVVLDRNALCGLGPQYLARSRTALPCVALDRIALWGPGPLLPCVLQYPQCLA